MRTRSNSSTRAGIFNSKRPGEDDNGALKFEDLGCKSLKVHAYPATPFRSAPTISEPLCPPKPKLLDMATRICRCRAWLGV